MNRMAIKRVMVIGLSLRGLEPTLHWGLAGRRAAAWPDTPQDGRPRAGSLQREVTGT
jgi:hypothetical protein